MKSGIEQTALNSPNLGPSSFIKSPTERPAIPFDALGDIATNAATIYDAIQDNKQSNDMFQGLQKELNQEQLSVEQQDRTYDFAANQVALVNPLEREVNRLADVAKNQSPEQAALTLDRGIALGNQVNQINDTYLAAYQQGRVSAEEYANRVQATIKSYIARNPVYRDELINEADKYMQYAGITSGIKSKQLLEQSEQDKYGDAIKAASAVIKEKGGDLSVLLNVGSPQFWDEAKRVQARVDIANQVELVSNWAKLQSPSPQEIDVRVTASNPQQRAAYQAEFANTLYNNWKSGKLGVGPNGKFDPVLAQKQINESYYTKEAELQPLLGGTSLTKPIVESQIAELKVTRDLMIKAVMGGVDAELAEAQLRELTARDSYANFDFEKNLRYTGQLAQTGRALLGTNPEEIKELRGRFNQLVSFTQSTGTSSFTEVDPTKATDKQAFQAMTLPLRKESQVGQGNYQEDNTKSLKDTFTQLNSLTDKTKATQLVSVFLDGIIDMSSEESVGGLYDHEGQQLLQEQLGGFLNKAVGDNKLEYLGNNTFVVKGPDGKTLNNETTFANKTMKALASAYGQDVKGKSYEKSVQAFVKSVNAQYAVRVETPASAEKQRLYKQMQGPLGRAKLPPTYEDKLVQTPAASIEKSIKAIYAGEEPSKKATKTNQGPEDFPRVDKATQKKRNALQVQVLQDEITDEQNALKEVEDKIKAEGGGNVDLIEAKKRHTRNIQNIQKELNILNK